MEDQYENIENYATLFDSMEEGKMYFMKEELTEVNYRPHLKIEFENCYSSIAKNGGLVAFCKKPKILIMDNANPLKFNVIVMSQNGNYLKLIPYDEKNKNLILFGFNYEEKLYGIHDDGTIIKFNIEIENYENKISSDIFKKEKIISCKFFEKGYVSQTEQFNFYVTKDIKNPFPYIFFPLKYIGVTKPIKEFLFLPSSITKSKQIELLFPNFKGNGIIHITGKGENEEFKEQDNYDEIKYIETDIKLPYNNNCGIDNENKEDILGNISALALSPLNNQIAMYRNDGTVFFFHKSLDEDLHNYPRIKVHFTVNDNPNDNYERNEQKAILEYNDNTQFLFCGEDAVCICGKRFIMLINSKNKTLYYKITEKSGTYALQNTEFMFCLTEIDGLRVITHKYLYFISKVSKELYHTCYPFSNHPAKKLLNAFKLDLEKSPNSDSEIRKIIEQLGDAIKTLLIAASKISYYDENNDKKKIQFYLLKAAQYGKNYVQNLNYDFFVQTCQEIRVLNNLHCCQNINDIPRYITYSEYKTIKDIIKILIRQNNFALAYDVCKYLNLDYSIHIIFQKYASSQIKKLGNASIQEQNQLYEKISKQLKNIPNISYIKLAKRAFKYGAHEIGSKFLKEEKSILTKIPQYIKLRDWDTAILLSIDTYDRNVIFSVIDKIFKDNKDNTKHFIEIISKYNNINLVVIEYLKAIKEKYPDLLEVYLTQNNLYEDLFFIYLERFFEIKNLHDRKLILGNLKTCLKRIKSNEFDFSFYKEYLNSLENSIQFKAQIIEKDYILNTDTGSFDNSIYDCYKICISHNNFQITDKENKTYKLSDKKYLIMKLRNFAEKNQFEEINKILEKNNNNLKKLNLTPYNLAQLYYDFKQYDEATKYIKQMIEPDYFTYKIELLKMMEKYDEAVEIIISDKDCDRKEDLINDIISKRPDLKPKCDELFKKFG